MNTPPSTPLSQNSYGELQRKTNGRMASCKTTSVHFHSFREWSATSPPSPLPATLPVSLSLFLSLSFSQLKNRSNRTLASGQQMLRRNGSIDSGGVGGVGGVVALKLPSISSDFFPPIIPQSINTINGNFWPMFHGPFWPSFAVSPPGGR